MKLGQRQVRPIVFAARSRARNVTGEADSDYSLYVDIRYADGSTSFGHALPFPVGTHDWQLRQAVIQPERPVDQLSVYCLLRNGHTGTAWFRDVVAREAPPDTRVFDGQLIRPAAALAIDRATGGGLFVRDVRAGSDLVQPPPRSDGRVPGLDLVITSRVQHQGDRTDVHVQLEDRRRSSAHSDQSRAISLYFALPLPSGAGPWIWGDDIRRQRPVTGAFDLAAVSREWDIGAVGAVSRHPFAAVWRDGQVLMLSHPLGEPRLVRLGASPANGLLYVVFDVALSAETRRFPGRAWVDFSIHRFPLDPLAAGNGFRAAVARYQQQHPADFARRFPVEREGTWLPFSAKSKIDRPADFGFGVHELHDLGEVASDQQLGIAPFRYLQVPDSYAVWLDEAPRAPAGPVHDLALAAAVKARLARQQRQGNLRQRREAEAILSSAFHDGSGRPVYRWSPAGQIPWCGGKAGCAFFAVSADPAIADRRWPLNKARVDWDQQARASYQQHPALAGEFVDGVQAATFRFLLDQRRTHWAVARQPLAFGAQGLTTGIPSLFATAAFVDWLAADVHGRGKLLMGNTLFEDVPWAGRAFDYLGVEVNWLRQAPGEAVRFVPDDDAKLSYRRTLAGQRPYGLLMNTDFAAFAAAAGGRAVERYFQIALFYGFYPSFFSADAANAPYWENPALVNRDRPLFRKYVPLIRRINAAGWQPMTGAASSDPAVHVERFGSWPDLHFTVRNTADRPVTARLTFQPALRLPDGLRLSPQVQPGAALPLSDEPTRASTVALAAAAVEVFRVDGGR